MSQTGIEPTTTRNVVEINGAPFEYDHSFENEEFTYFYQIDDGLILDTRKVPKSKTDLDFDWRKIGF
ncbi:hypothetical protein Pan241w_20060 [Gimesia alba]|uniref:Uncharacterized protein n=1 Tax=Gimesia alba TaxID=2527973 RepID=A0A517RDI5_9PLAN|nr:hypothetical protein [Gimesia alba]QDT41926.1 hypothetical protein Pan241w_20060 [Gimesia alba]